MHGSIETQAHDKQSRDKVYWHLAFFEALQLELYQYLEALNFTYEHQLTKEALRIDVLVIKNERGIKIAKNIGRIFRLINLFEFKSEKDGLTVDDYNKVLGYAYIYASFHGIDISDITISFAVTIYPRDLMKYLEKRGLTVTETESGIYFVEGEAFSIQILESKKLSAETNLFLKNLRSNLSKEEARRTVDAYKALKEFESKSAYIDRLINANKAVFKEVMEMSDAVLQEMLVKAVAEERGWLEARDREKAREVARGLKADNVPLHIIVKNTRLSIHEVEAL